MITTRSREIPKMPVRRKAPPSIRPSARGWGAAAIAIALRLGAVGSAQQQRREDVLMTTTAQAIIRQAEAVDAKAQVVALRTFVRRHVTWHGAVYRRTRMLRATASRTLQTGKGYCGEDT